MSLPILADPAWQLYWGVGCGVPSLIVSSAPRPNLSVVWVVDRWVWMLLLVRNGHVSGEMVVCVGRLRASCIELSSRTTLQCPPLVVVEPKGRARCPECVDRHDSTTSVHRCSIVLSDAEYLSEVKFLDLRTTAKAFAKDVFINQERKLGARRRSDTVLVSTINDADQGSADVAFRTPPAPYEKSKSLGSGGSMVARLKLKGIDGRAPPGVEPAA
ncbi:hypothetical protein V6N11_028518 [Hibiscus sabdariffa]|uniref:Uncharacterized protein n=1 Tax=Hibiscus sabdariffa TaxID=183260 RepID=A0ABR2NEI0_9ROSI